MSNDYDDEHEEIDCIVLKATDKALLVNVDGQEVWIPRSVCIYGGGIELSSKMQTIYVQQWFYEKEF